MRLDPVQVIEGIAALISEHFPHSSELLLEAATDIEKERMETRPVIAYAAHWAEHD